MICPGLNDSSALDCAMCSGVLAPLARAAAQILKTKRMERTWFIMAHHGSGALYSRHLRGLQQLRHRIESRETCVLHHGW